MDTAKRAAELLHQTEVQLRELLSEAAATSDYESVVKIASWASTVSNLVKITTRINSGGPSAELRRHCKEAKLESVRKHVRRSTGKVGYPRFMRESDDLIRISWSKREKKEYRHRAPYSTIQTLAAAISKLGTDGRIFSTEELLPVSDADGAEIPSYQAYAGIALLKHAGLIDQHGRRGYSIPRLAEFPHALQSVWEKIPKK